MKPPLPPCRRQQKPPPCLLPPAAVPVHLGEEGTAVLQGRVCTNKQLIVNVGLAIYPTPVGQQERDNQIYVATSVINMPKLQVAAVAHVENVDNIAR